MSKKKLGEYPKWLYNDDPRQFGCGRRYQNGWVTACRDDPSVDPCKEHKVCLWLCSGCGAPEFFRQQENKHGAPSNGVRDASDPRYLYERGPCWRSNTYGVKCVTPKAWRVLYHDEAPWPNMDVWNRLEAHGRMVASRERSERARQKREGHLQADANTGGGTQENQGTV